MRRVLALLFMFAALPGFAQDAPAKAKEEVAKEARKLQQQLGEQFRDKKYDAAADTCREFIKLLPNEPAGHYNLACALARLGKNDEALVSLEKSIEAGYADASHLRKDDDLTALRANPRFAALVSKTQANRGKLLARLPIDSGKEIAGLKTIEANPEGGLRYRLRLSEKATPEKPHRLIVWLHPSGGSMNNVVESLAPRFADKGFALLVLTQKGFLGWSEEDASQLLDKTIPDVARRNEVDARRPLLLGYSAGGQMALELWYAEPSRWGGLVLDAAYPVRMENGRYVPRPLPKMEGIKKTPLFVLVGDKDGGSPLWKKLTPDWRDAGVPLTIHHVEGKGHTWLFGKSEVDMLENWLAEIAADKLPGASDK